MRGRVITLALGFALAGCQGGGGEHATVTTRSPATTTTTLSTTTFPASCGPAIHAAGIGAGHADDAPAVAADIATLDRLGKSEPDPQVAQQIAVVERQLGALATAATGGDVGAARSAASGLTQEVQRLSSICGA